MASGDDIEKKTEKCKKVRNPSDLIRKIVDLMEYPVSQNATERHLQLLREFLNATKYAFWLHDINYIIRLYEAIIRKLDTAPEFKKPLECLLYFSAVPPMQTKVSQRLEYEKELQEYFSVLGDLLLCLHDDHLTSLVLSTIAHLLEPSAPVGYCCVPLDDCKIAAERSRLPELLAEFLHVIGDNLYEQLLDVLFIICRISTKACVKILNGNAIEYLLLRLEPTWRKRDTHTKPQAATGKDTIPHLSDTCSILWKLLNVMEEEKVKVENPSISALWSVQYAYRWVFVALGRQHERNNFSAIILKLLINFPTMEFVESDLADDIAILAMTAAGCHCYNIKFEDNEIDFQFKKILWTCLQYYKQYNTNQIMKHNRIMKVFTHYIFKNFKNKNQTEQHCELMKIALRTIPKFVTSSVQLFLKVNAPFRIIKAIESYLEHEFEVEILEAFICCLYEILLVEIDNITINFGENKASNILMAVCNKIISTKTLTYSYQKYLARSFCCLHMLAKSGYVVDEAVIDLCFTYFNRVVHPREGDPLIDARVTICCVHFLWDIITTFNTVHIEFLKKGGIYHILDIVELSPFPVKAIALGILADVTKRHFCVPYFITWRKRGRKLMPMLLEIFRGKTETRCDRSNMIRFSSNREENQWKILCQEPKITFQNYCTSNNEILQSCRYKIHAIIYALKVKFKKKVDIANGNYNLYNEKFTTDDELTMLFAENFLSLKMCETWTDVYKDLQNEGVVPVEDDYNHLVDRIRRIFQWKSYLQATISQIVQKEFLKEQFNELETYITLKEARLSDALDALQELKYITSCTERMFQMRKKMRLSQEVEAIRNRNANYHKTMTDLPFTNIYDQKVDIESDVIAKANEEIPEFECISADYDEFVELRDDDEEVPIEPPLMQC